MNADQIPEPLLDALRSSLCVPFLGAGFSMNARCPRGSNMPSGRSLAHLLASQGKFKNSDDLITVATEFQRRFGKAALVKYVERALHVDTAKPAKVHRAFARLPYRRVYTTNFDYLIEDTYRIAKTPCCVIGSDIEHTMNAADDGSERVRVIKFHGDFRCPEHMVLTQQDYDGFIEERPYTVNSLASDLQQKTPLFIGYSRADPNFKAIRKIFALRLSTFERVPFSIEFDVEQKKVEEILDTERVNIISLNTGNNPSKYSNVLAEFLNLIAAQVRPRR